MNLYMLSKLWTQIRPQQPACLSEACSHTAIQLVSFKLVIVALLPVLRNQHAVSRQTGSEPLSCNTCISEYLNHTHSIE